MNKLIFVSDLFVEDYIGGAELTMEALIQSYPNNNAVLKLHSRNFTQDLIEKNPDVTWILVNYSGCSRDSLQELGSNANNKFFIIECDYKYCKYRSSHLHYLKENRDCDCHFNVYPGKFTKGLMKRAQKVFFMSQGQLDEYLSRFPVMKSWTNLVVQGSTWSLQHLEKLKHLDEINKVKNGKWAVLGGASWIKNQQHTEIHLKKLKLDYDVIGGLPYEQFIETLSNYEGLCFIPMGFDTDPRIVIEAKLMGLNLILGDLVQSKKYIEEISKEDLYESLLSKQNNFWKMVIE